MTSFSSRPYAEVIGDPIGHSKSPCIHGFWLEELGIEAEYRACHVRLEELADYFEQRRQDPDWRGCNVTIPHKEKVRAFLDEVDDKVRTVGAVNTVYRSGSTLVGTNTDVDGVAEALAGIELARRDVCLIGAGGAARAAFAVLASRQVGSLRVLARNPDKAVRVAGECGIDATGISFGAGSAAFDGAILVVNATQLGMVGQEAMPGFVLAELDALAGDALVFDMVYNPLETELLAAARKKGLRTVDGLVMLVGQAATAFERIFGQPPPRENDAKLRALLTS